MSSSARLGVMAMAVIVGLVAGACGDSADPSTPRAPGNLEVVATTSILGDVVGNIVGEDGTVEVLIPAGVDPHDYRASSQQTAAIQRADLVVANGLRLEEGLDDLLRSAIDDGANILNIAEQVDPITFPDGEFDPHVWLDPIRMADATRLVAAELTAIDDSVDWAARAEAYAATLVSTNEAISAVLSGIRDDDRKLVTNHDSLRYFAHRYGFEIVGVVIPGGSTLAAPSSGELADLVAAIDREEVPAIFADTTAAMDLAEAIAREATADIAVVELSTGSLGEPGSGAETLVGMLQTNAGRIADALSGT